MYCSKKVIQLKTETIKDTNECLELAQYTLKLLQLAFTDLSHKRRYLIRPELRQSYKPLCNDANKVTEFLFGGNVDEKMAGVDFHASSMKGQGLRYRSHGHRFGSKGQNYHSNNYSQSVYKADQNNNVFLGKGRGRRPLPTPQKK